MAAAAIQIPILSEDIIISVVRDITKMALTANDLKAPTAEKLYAIYSGFICSLLNASNEQITQVPLHAVETIAHPELYVEEAVGKIVFVKALEYLFSACCINDFTMNDLISPSRKRTRKLLSAIVNYAQFYTQHEKVKHDVLTKVETMLKDREVLTTKQDALKEQIATIKAQRLEKQRAVQEMNLSALKAREQEITDTLKQQVTQIESKRAEVQELQNVMTVSKASKLIRQGDDSVQEHLTRGHNLTVKEKLCNEFGETVPSILKLIKNIERDTANVLSCSNDVERLKDKSLEESLRIKNMVSSIQNTKRSIKSKAEKKTRNVSQDAKRMELCNENKLKSQKKEETVLQDVTNKHQKVDAMKLELKELTELSLLSTKEHKRVLKILDEKFDALNEKVSIYNSVLKVNSDDINLQLQHYQSS